MLAAESIDPTTYIPRMPSVLVIDDNPEMVQYLQALIRRHVEVIYTLTDPVQALHALTQWRPDIVFIDIVMPGLNGVDLMAQARDAGCTSRFVVVTGGFDSPTIPKHVNTRWLEAEFNCEVVYKPFNRKDVARVLGLPLKSP